MEAAPILMGIGGKVLSQRERDWIKREKPVGFLLFARSIETVEQTRELCAELAELSVTSDPLIMVDQEGGRVQRVTFAGKHPAAQVLGAWYRADPTAALEGCYLNAMLLAAQLRDVGATCLLGPLLDVRFPSTHAVIGERAFSDNPTEVIALGEVFAKGVHAGGCWNCMKHVPGHGRTTLDTHFELPRVTASWQELQTDFEPFRQLGPLCDMAMTAHICFTALDEEVPATYSPRLVQLVREDWQFERLLMADDVGMKALPGSYDERILSSLSAGCDVVIASFSKLIHGVAGTVWDVDNFEVMEQMAMPRISSRGWKALQGLHLPAPVDHDEVLRMRTRLQQLWADGPARMGYTWPA